MPTTTRLRGTLAIAATALIGLGAGMAGATIPDAADVIHGCYRTSSGALRVIDTATGDACRSGEKGLDWNRQGPPGTAFDPRGITTHSDQAFFDPDFSFTSALAQCDANERPISGGHSVPPHVELQRSEMTLNGWYILVDRPNPSVNPGPITAFVYCVPIPE